MTNEAAWQIPMFYFFAQMGKTKKNISIKLQSIIMSHYILQ